MQALHLFSSCSSSENSSDCHPADSRSFHFQAWLIHYKAIWVPEISIVITWILRNKNCWIFEVIISNLTTVEVNAKYIFLEIHSTHYSLSVFNMSEAAPTWQQNKQIADKKCSLIKSVQQLNPHRIYFPFRSLLPFLKTQSHVSTKMWICLEESISTCFHKTSCLNTIRGQMLKLSVECRSAGASSPLCFHTCIEGFQFTGKALYDSAEPFCCAEIKHNTKKKLSNQFQRNAWVLI